jgi:WD40 repeat protein
MTVSNQGNILFAGSSNGVLYVWDLPSGILLRKLSVHSNEIKKVINFKFGYLLTASKNEVKIWPLSAFLL